MKDKIKNRCDELIKIGNEDNGKIGYYNTKPEYWFQQRFVPVLQQWIASVVTFFEFAAIDNSYYIREVKNIVSDKDLKTGVAFHSHQKLLGLLASFREELELGFLKNFELMIVSLTYDNFLDEAEIFHKANKKIESSILVSVVFENTIRKIAIKNDIKEEGESIEEIINKLTKTKIFTGVQAKRIKSYASLRNEALHTHWDKFEIREVGIMIKGTRDLIETKLDSQT